MGYVKVGILPVADIFETKSNENGVLEVKDDFEAEFLNMLSKGLGVKFIYNIPNFLIDGQVIGHWAALINMVKNYEVDIAVSKISITEERSLEVNYSYPYAVNEMTFAAPIPSAISNIFAFVNPFSKNLWIAIAILVIVYPLVFQCFKSKGRTNKNLHFKFYGSLFNQNLLLKAKNKKQKLLTICWIFSTMLLSLSYATSLLSFLSVPFRERGIRTIPELTEAVKSGAYSCAHLTGTGAYALLYGSTEPNIKIIGQHLKKNFVIFNPDKSLILAQMYKRKLILIATRSDLHNLLEPEVYIASETFGISPLCVMFNRNFKQIQKLNNLIHRITASGIYQKSIRDYAFLKHLHLKEATLEQEQKPKQLTMDDLQGVFLLFIFGIVLSILVFVSEVTFWKFTHR